MWPLNFRKLPELLIPTQSYLYYYAGRYSASGGSVVVDEWYDMSESFMLQDEHLNA